MGIFTTIGQFLKAILFFLNLWKQKDKQKAEREAEVGHEIIEAFKQTDKKIRASRLNAVVGRIKRL